MSNFFDLDLLKQVSATIVGVPSDVTAGNYENLGIVISVNNVNKFLK